MSNMRDSRDLNGRLLLRYLQVGKKGTGRGTCSKRVTGSAATQGVTIRTSLADRRVIYAGSPRVPGQTPGQIQETEGGRGQMKEKVATETGIITLILCQGPLITISSTRKATGNVTSVTI